MARQTKQQALQQEGNDTLHEAQKALWAAEARYQSLVETSTDAIFCLGLDMTIQLANRPAAELFGFSGAKEMGGVGFLALVAPAQEGYLRSQLAAVAPGWRFAGD